MTLFASSSRLAIPVELASAVAVIACAGALTAACSSPAHPRAQSQPGASRLSSGASAHAAPSVMPSTTPAAIPSSSAPGSSSTLPPVPQPAPAPVPAPAPSVTAIAAPSPLAPCSTAALRASVGSANGAAGSIYYPLDFTNISGTPCGLYGFPGVSFAAAPGGGQLGGAAIRNPTFRPALVTLAPGQVAHASVQVVVAQNYPASICKPATAHWLRVYPPGQFAPLYAGLTAVTCTGSIPSGSTLGIYVVRPGANGP
jgi:hypothetical protein